MHSSFPSLRAPAALFSGRRRRLGSAFLGMILPVVAAAEDDYTIKLERPEKVGNTYRIMGKGTRKHRAVSVAGGRTLSTQDELLAAELSADVEVLAVSPKEKAQKVRLTGTRLAFSSAGRPADVFPDGTEVVAERVGSKTQFTVGGNPANDLEAKALGLVFELGSDESPDDSILGTDQRQRVGGRWRLNPKAAAASLAVTMGAKVAPQDVTGSCELKEVVETDQGAALRIEGQVVVTNLSVPLPKGLAVRKSEARASLAGLYPVDVSKGMMSQSLGVSTEIEIAGENAGVPIQIKTTGITQRDARFVYR